MAYQRVEVLTGTERRRTYTPAEKVRMVEEAFRPGVVVTEAARRLGVHESLLYRWRGLMQSSGTAVAEPSSFVALTFTSAINDPARFTSSKAVGPHFGLTPRKYQFGETDVTGAISETGDALVRGALYEAAQVMLTRTTSFSTLKRWALDVAKRRGMMRAKVALARKLATVLHRMWVDGTDFRFGKETAAA